MSEASVLSASPSETAELGAMIGRVCQAGDVICLAGELGAGKTHLTQGIAAGLGIDPHDVTSPTYALLAEHFSGRLPLYHMDAYRINDASELGPIGYEDYIDRADGVFVIEWAERIADALPLERLEIRILHGDTSESDELRRLHFQPFGSRATSLADYLIASSRVAHATA